MHGVLAIAHLSGSPHWVRLWNALLSDPRYLRTMVQETAIIGIWYYRHWSITGWNNHSNCRQKLD